MLSSKYLLHIRKISHQKNYVQNLPYFVPKYIILSVPSEEVSDYRVEVLWGKEATDFKNGISMVVLAGKRGIMDTTGKLLIPCEMDEIIEAGKGMMKVEKNQKTAYYNILLQKQVWAEAGF